MIVNQKQRIDEVLDDTCISGETILSGISHGAACLLSRRNHNAFARRHTSREMSKIVTGSTYRPKVGDI